MAIGTVQWSTQQFATAAASTAVNMPATVNAGDFLFIWGRVNNTFAFPAITVPAGWTVVYHTSVTGGTNPPTMIFMYKTGMASGTEGGTSVTVTHANNISTWISGSVSGVDSTTPIDATPVVGDTNVASNSSTLSGYTTTVAGCLGFFIASETGTAATSTPPGGWTEQADNTAGTNVGTLCWQAGLASGSQGTVANTWSASLKHIEAIFALRPATTGTNFTQSPSDPVGITDQVVIEHGFGQVVSDSTGLTDTFQTIMDYARPVTDSMGLTDQIILSQGFGRNISDDTGITDQVVLSQGYGRNVSDAVGITDSVVISLDRTLVIMDSVGISDPATESPSTIRPVDTVNITDTAILTVTGGQLPGTIMDQINQDLITRGFTGPGTVLDRERQRLVAATGKDVGYTIDDLYEANGERNRVALESVAILPDTA